MGECIRMIPDIMSFTKQKNVPGAVVLLEPILGSIEWNCLQKHLEVLRFGPELRQWIKVVYNDISSSVLNNGYASEYFLLPRGVRRGCPLTNCFVSTVVSYPGHSYLNSNDSYPSNWLFHTHFVCGGNSFSSTQTAFHRCRVW